MKALRCPSCGGLILKTAENSYKCQSCGTIQVFEKPASTNLQDNEDADALVRLAVQTTLMGNYREAFHLWERICHTDVEKPWLKDCHTYIQESANALLLSTIMLYETEQSFENAEHLIWQYDRSLNLLVQAGLIADVLPDDSSYNEITLDILDLILRQLQSITSKRLTRRQFYRFKESILASDLILRHLLESRLLIEEKQLIRNLDISLLKALLSKNEDDLLPDKWGAYKHIPRLDEVEVSSLMSTIQQLMQMKEVTEI